MYFKTNFITNGFLSHSYNTRVVYNGTFFNNTYFPTIGYDPDFELELTKKRKKYNLAPRERLMVRTNPKGLSMNPYAICDVNSLEIHMDFQYAL